MRGLVCGALCSGVRILVRGLLVLVPVRCALVRATNLVRGLVRGCTQLGIKTLCMYIYIYTYIYTYLHLSL